MLKINVIIFIFHPQFLIIFWKSISSTVSGGMCVWGGESKFDIKEITCGCVTV